MGLAKLNLDTARPTTTLFVAGRLITEALPDLEDRFREIHVSGSHFTIDLKQLDAIDTGGALLITGLENRLRSAGTEVEILGSDDHLSLLNTVSASLPAEEGIETHPTGFLIWLERVGHGVVDGSKAMVSFVSFFGLTLSRLAKTIAQPRRLRATALVSQMQDAGFNAIPIVALMGFLIGIVLAFQGAAQLRQFGAEVFVVELISISILRELGILLTAIIVAGRSGSAFTASIGSMKVQEEIDAMRTLGLDPIEVLVLPRVLALIIVLPILGLVANLSGLFGGMLMSWIELDVSPALFVTRLKENTDVWNLAVGMIKAPFFALMIASVGCWQAMQVQGSAESVGRRTTSSVVQSIFLVITVDAMFSVFFSEIGL